MTNQKRHCWNCTGEGCSGCRWDVVPTFVLADDGTMDTVIRCEACGREERFNFACGPDDEDGTEYTYDAFVADCIEQCEADHVCEDDDETEVAEYRWVIRAMTPGGSPWVVGQAWSYDGILGLVERVPMSDAVRVERWLGDVRLTTEA